MNKSIFKEGYARIILSFPNRKLNMDMMYEMLKDLEDTEFVNGVNSVCSTVRELFPDTNIVALIRERSRYQDLPTPGEAWGIVMSEVSRVGSWGSPSFENELVGRAVKIMGWQNICLSENQIADRVHFMKIYEQLSNRTIEDRIRLPETEGTKAIDYLVNAIISNQELLKYEVKKGE